MKNKILFSILALLVASVIFFSFKISRTERGLYKSLDISQQDEVKRRIISSLKKDSIFALYNEISNAEIEALAAVTTPLNAERKKALSTLSSTLELTKYYRELGVENPEKLARLAGVKSLLLVALIKKYPDFKDMDTKSRREVIKGSKKPLSEKDKAKRRDNLMRAIQRNNLKN